MSKAGVCESHFSLKQQVVLTNSTSRQVFSLLSVLGSVKTLKGHLLHNMPLLRLSKVKKLYLQLVRPNEDSQNFGLKSRPKSKRRPKRRLRSHLKKDSDSACSETSDQLLRPNKEFSNYGLKPRHQPKLRPKRRQRSNLKKDSNSACSVAHPLTFPHPQNDFHFWGDRHTD
jgi:hypothetical protein